LARIHQVNPLMRRSVAHGWLLGLAMGLGPVLQGQTERLDDWQRGHHVCVLGADSDAVYLGRVPQELALNAAVSRRIVDVA
jgi:hypothetical protein